MKKRQKIGTKGRRCRAAFWRSPLSVSSRFGRFETLEQRALLAADTWGLHVVSTEDASVYGPGETSEMFLEVGGASGATRLGFLVHAQEGANLDPTAVEIRDGTGARVKPILSVADRGDNDSESLVVAELPNGQFTIAVGGEEGSFADFQLHVFLPGDQEGHGQVTDQAVQDAYAAWLQSSGKFTGVTALLVASHGNDLMRDHYQMELDADLDGTIDAFDMQQIRANVNRSGQSVQVDLIADAQGPTIDVSLANDTGHSASDGVTTGAAIAGGITDASQIVNFTAKVDAGETVELSDFIGQDFNQEGIFTIDQDELEQLAGKVLVDTGQTHTAFFTAVDEFGNVSSTMSVTFSVDTIAPSAPIELKLESGSDSGELNDLITNDATPTILAEAEDQALVELFVGGQVVGQEVVNSPVSITTTELNQGVQSITAKATDVAGNISESSESLTLQIDTQSPLTPTFDLAAAFDTGAGGDQLTTEVATTLEGTTEAQVAVELRQNSVVLQTTSSSSTGDFSFTTVDLPFGATDFTAVARDLAANESSFTTSITRNDPPQIDNQSRSLQENTSNDTIVGDPITASDPNLAVEPTESLSFTILDGNTGGAFAIDSATGQITVANSDAVDFETNPSFEIIVQVTDAGGDGMGGVGLTANATISIGISDLNEPPGIDPIQINTDEDAAPLEVPVLEVGNVTDQDVGDMPTLVTVTWNESASDREVDFSLLDDLFSFDPGQLGDLDTGDTATAVFDVSITDGVNVVASTMTIIVTGVNDPPTVDPINVTTNEDAAGLTIDLLVESNASDYDLNDAPTLNDLALNPAFSTRSDVEYGLAEGVVTFDPAQFGDLPDDEADELVFDFSVSDGDQATDSRLTILVEGRNDAPTIEDTVTLVVNPAEAVAGTPVGTVIAADPDRGNTLTYAVTGGTGTGIFDLDSQSGEITVAQTAELPLEDGAVLTLEVNVSDSGTPPLGTVAVVMVNVTANLPPQIILGGSTGSENDSQSHKFTWDVSDPEGALEFVEIRVLQEGETAPVFADLLASFTGSFPFDDLGIGTFTLEATASDDVGNSSQATRFVIITDDDANGPEIEMTGSSGSELDGETQQVSWNITDANSGLQNVSVQVSQDGVVLHTFLDAEGVFPFDSYGLGLFEFHVIATDSDNDRPEDASTSTLTHSVTVADDDTEGPEIATSTGLGDENPQLDSFIQKFFWSISDTTSQLSPLGFTASVFQDDSLVATFNTSYDDFFFDELGLGTFRLSVLAIDNDNDWVGDASSSVHERTLVVTDDDPLPGIELTGSNGTELVSESQSFSWQVGDGSGTGLTGVTVTVTKDGMEILPVDQRDDFQGTFNFDTINGMEAGPGTYAITVTARDDDNDWPGDGEVQEMRTVVVEQDVLTPEVAFRMETTDLEGNVINQVVQGEDFELRVYVEDIRPIPTGVFAAYLDVEYDNQENISLIFGETQRLQLTDRFHGQVDANDNVTMLDFTSGSFFLTQGQQQTDPVNFTGNILALTNALQSELEQLLGAGNVEVVHSPVDLEGTENDIYFSWDMTFVGDLQAKDIENLVVDISELVTTDGQMANASMVEISPAAIDDPNTFKTAFVPGDLYGLGREGDLEGEGVFSEVGSFSNRTNFELENLFSNGGNLLFRIGFNADQLGQVTFSANAAELAHQTADDVGGKSDVLVFTTDPPEIPTNRIDYGEPISIQIAEATASSAPVAAGLTAVDTTGEVVVQETEDLMEDWSATATLVSDVSDSDSVDTLLLSSEVSDRESSETSLLSVTLESVLTEIVEDVSLVWQNQD